MKEFEAEVEMTIDNSSTNALDLCICLHYRDLKRSQVLQLQAMVFSFLDDVEEEMTIEEEDDPE